MRIGNNYQGIMQIFSRVNGGNKNKLLEIPDKSDTIINITNAIQV